MNADISKLDRGTSNQIIRACLIVTILVSGCGGSSDKATEPAGTTPPTGTAPDTQLISGQAVKGPMHDATVEVLDPSGNVLATGQVQNGSFELSAAISAYSHIEIRTRGGYFMDEATGLRVDVSSDEGLHAMVCGRGFRDSYTTARTDPGNHHRCSHGRAVDAVR
jgi:hypothetical protein